MKEIRGHRSWTMDELIEIFCKGGSYCMPTLPHYRYERVQRCCRELKQLGFIEKSGVTDVGINYRPTALFRDWQKEKEAGLTDSMPIKWHKKKRKALIVFFLAQHRYQVGVRCD